MKVLITGATGTIGNPLCSHLLDNGYVVAALSRNKKKAANFLHGRTQVLQWDPEGSNRNTHIHDENDWTAKCGEIDAVVNLAGESIAGKRWSKKRKRQLYNSRINATRTVVNAIKDKKINPSLLINASAVGFYDYHPEKAFTEDDGPGADFLAELCSAWEAEAVKAESSGVRVVRLRTGIVLSKDGGTIKQMLPAFKMFAGGYFWDGSHLFSWIHIDDAVRAVRFIIDNKDFSGPVNMSAPAPATNKQFVKAIGRALRRPAFLPIPRFAVWLRYGAMAEPLYKSQAMTPAKLQQAGFNFLHSDINKAVDHLLG